jgi:hypothetical protein
MDDWYEELVEHAESFGLKRQLVDQFEDRYDRRLRPLQALIVTLHEAGLCSEEGDFGPEWQGIGPNDAGEPGCYDEDVEDDDEEDF